MSTRSVSITAKRQLEAAQRPARSTPRNSAVASSTRRGCPGPDILVVSLLVFIAVVCAALGGLGLAAI